MPTSPKPKRTLIAKPIKLKLNTDARNRYRKPTIELFEYAKDPIDVGDGKPAWRAMATFNTAAVHRLDDAQFEVRSNLKRSVGVTREGYTIRIVKGIGRGIQIQILDGDFVLATVTGTTASDWTFAFTALARPGGWASY